MKSGEFPGCWGLDFYIILIMFDPCQFAHIDALVCQELYQEEPQEDQPWETGSSKHCLKDGFLNDFS